MRTKTDNPAEIGMHVFERANLGKAPFQVFGMYESVFVACPGAPRQPGTCCDFCGTGIMDVFAVRGADGCTFKVGSSCIDKTGDKGLIKAYKNNPEYRALQAKKRALKDDAVKAEWAILTTDPVAVEKLSAQFVDSYHGKTPWLTYALRAWGYCGASGRGQYLRAAKKIIAGTLTFSTLSTPTQGA
jgi:predicted dehydrogenase